MNAAQLINQTSGKVEYYTPKPIVEAARLTMGTIDLDPASSLAANESISATDFFTEQCDGLSRMWHGNVWMNHPFARGQNHLWIDKLVSEFESSRVQQACCITFASTSEKWFRPLLFRPQCFLYGRTNYLLPNGEVLRGCTKGSVVTYFGPYPDRFRRFFQPLGAIKV